jgi:hypothetical protein
MRGRSERPSCLFSGAPRHRIERQASAGRPIADGSPGARRPSTAKTPAIDPAPVGTVRHWVISRRRGPARCPTMASSTTTRLTPKEHQMTTQRFGRAAYLFAVAIVVAALGLAFGLESAAAGQKSETSVGQNTFVGGCRKTGGKPSRVASRVVKCDHGDGSSTTCDFNTSPAICTYVPAAFVPGAGGDHVNLGTVAGAERPPTVDRTGGVTSTAAPGMSVSEDDRGS